MSNGVSVGIIGMGNVGPAIGSALRASGAQIVGVAARSEQAVDRADAMLPGIPILSEDEVASKAEILILAVPDAQVEPLAKRLVESGGIRPGMVVIHLAGALGLEALEPAQRIGAITIALHPAMTFSGTSLDVQRLQNCPIAYTTSPLAQPVARALIEYLGGRALAVENSARPLYHAALAHVANHLVTLVVEGEKALAQAGVEDASATLRPLVEAAVERALTEGIAGLTGPVARGDERTVASHLEALETNPELTGVARTYAALAQATRNALGVPRNGLVVRTRDELQKALKADPRPTSLVMTMGALHEGHLSLVDLAKRNGHKVVATVFVNPQQFGPNEDYDRYPRDLDKDVDALAAAGVDIIYAPSTEEVYPTQPQTWIEPGAAGTTLEGSLRPGHFAGVLQVVGKMMNLIRPDVAVFGQKDAQQYANIRQMVADLDMPVELVQAPIIRAEDGVALSSRNSYLSADERVSAQALRRALEVGEDAAANGASPAEIVEAASAVLSGEPGIQTDYVALADAESFAVAALQTSESDRLGVEDLTTIAPDSRAYLLVSAQVGSTRLIDNTLVEVKTSDRPSHLS